MAEKRFRIHLCQFKNSMKRPGFQLIMHRHDSPDFHAGIHPRKADMTRPNMVNPNVLQRIFITFSPDTPVCFGSRNHLEGGDDRSPVIREGEFFQIQGCCFFQIGYRFLDRCSLADCTDFGTLGNIHIFFSVKYCGKGVHGLLSFLSLISLHEVLDAVTITQAGEQRNTSTDRIICHTGFFVTSPPRDRNVSQISSLAGHSGEFGKDL